MTQHQVPIIAGIFQEESQARDAVNALKNAGFAYDQVGVAQKEGSVTTQDLQQDLIKLGMPQDRAAYYENEFKSGRTIISVRPDGRDEEVRNIFRSNNAYDYDVNNGSIQMMNTDQADHGGPVDYRQSAGIPGDSQADGTNYNQPGGSQQQDQTS